MTEKNIPKVLVLGSITPTDDGNSLSYAKLTAAVDKHRPFEYARQTQFYETLVGTLEEDEAARQLAMHYLLETAEKGVKAASISSRRVWAERYTQASSELYGTPEVHVVQELIQSEYTKFLQCRDNPAVDKGLLDKVLAVYETTVLDHSMFRPEVEVDKYADAALEVREFVDEHYADIVETIFTEESVNTPEVIADKFTRALTKLAEMDPTWEQWTVEVVPDKDALSVMGGDKKILVGANRRIPTGGELKGLFAHEVLVHAQRAVNGSKKSYELSSGLPGYLDIEEGLGTFFEYAVTGVVPQKNIDRYTDIALALGVVTEQMPRNAMLSFVYAREVVRLQALGNEVDEGNIQKKVAAHVNRIYRGTTGDDDAIGVFTKDIVYYKGFQEAADYITEQLRAGRGIDTVLSYLLQGKFNPFDERHVAYLERHAT